MELNSKLKGGSLSVHWKILHGRKRREADG